MKNVRGLPATIVFRLGTVGSVAGDLFAERIQAYEIGRAHV